MNSEQDLQEIGHSACSSVWASNDSSKPEAYKRGDGGRRGSLPNDFNMHEFVLQSFRGRENLRLCIPGCFELIRADNEEWWDRNGGRLPPPFDRKKRQVLESEQVHSISNSVKQELVDMSCPEPLRDRMTQNAARSHV